VLEALHVESGQWDVERVESRGRRGRTPDGDEVDLSDSVVRLRRR
jgi:hypothetical protein